LFAFFSLMFTSRPFAVFFHSIWSRDPDIMPSVYDTVFSFDQVRAVITAQSFATVLLYPRRERLHLLSIYPSFHVRCGWLLRSGHSAICCDALFFVRRNQLLA
jgi:hypothetical protein